jgi:hypothetical protein
MHDLQDLLDRTLPGKISETGDIIPLLAEHWHEFKGSTETSMAAHKLLGRMENVEWQPPILSFIIERHGGTVLGSTRATLQCWSLNLDTMTAECEEAGQRQLKPKASALKKTDIEILTKEIVVAILQRKVDDRLRWKDDGTIQVMVAKIIPDGSGYKQTVQGRRKRLGQALEAALTERGWQPVGRNVFKKAEL